MSSRKATSSFSVIRARVSTAGATMWGRAFIVWLLVMAVEFVLGTLRFLFLRPRVGDFRSAQIGVVIGSAFFFIVVYICEPWLSPRTAANAVKVGFLWVALTLLFEFIFGRYAMNRSWDSLVLDYNLSRGGLMPLGLMIFGLSPLIALQLRRRKL